MTKSPNPAKTCKSCELGVEMPEEYKCNSPVRNKYSDETGSYDCPKDGGSISYASAYLYSKGLPRGEKCLGCAELLVRNAAMVCHLTPDSKSTFPDNWCGQWQEKGSF